MARIIEHLSVEELGPRYHGVREAAEAWSTRAIRLLAQGRGVLNARAAPAFAPRRFHQPTARHNAIAPAAPGGCQRRNGRATSAPPPALLANARRTLALVFPPPCSPKLQPAVRLWPLVDEPVANKRFATTDAVVADRCRRLNPAASKPHTDVHRWPKPKRPT